MRKYFIYVILSGLIFSQSDILYLVDSEGNKKKVIGNFKGIVWEKGEVDFIGNDGISYTDPSNILSIENKNGEELVASKLLEGFRKDREKKKDEELCEKNSKKSIVMMPVRNDFYGFGEFGCDDSVLRVDLSIRESWSPQNLRKVSEYSHNFQTNTITFMKKNWLTQKLVC